MFILCIQINKYVMKLCHRLLKSLIQGTSQLTFTPLPNKIFFE